MRTQKKKAAEAGDIPRGAPAAGAANPPTRIPYLIGRTDRIVKRRLAEVLAPHGLTVPQFTALSVLYARGPSSNAQIAERSLISPQAANEVVKAMEARGWIAREPDAVHGRIVMLSLTDSARELLASCDETVSRLEEEMLAGIDPQHVALLRDLLLTCGRNLR